MDASCTPVLCSGYQFLFLALQQSWIVWMRWIHPLPLTLTP